MKRKQFDSVEKQRERARQQFGTRDPKCARCDERDPLALTGTHPDVLCKEHRLLAQGASAVEEHHVAGQRNSPFVVKLPANEHQILSASQREWPAATLRNADGSPLLAIAATIRGWLEVLRQIIERAVGWIPEALESLDEILTERFGPKWWDVLGWEVAR